MITSHFHFETSVEDPRGDVVGGPGCLDRRQPWESPGTDGIETLSMRSS